MKMKNIVGSIMSQKPFFKNFIKTKNGFGIFSIKSHQTEYYGEKIKFFSKEKALKAATQMSAKTGKTFSVYKCMYCDYWHIGKDRIV